MERLSLNGTWEMSCDDDNFWDDIASLNNDSQSYRDDIKRFTADIQKMSAENSKVMSETLDLLSGRSSDPAADPISLKAVTGAIPGSVYSFLLDAGMMPEPSFRDNELKCLGLMKYDYTFKRKFDVPASFLYAPHQILRFDGIDTLADIYMNESLLGSVNNMHRSWEYDVKNILKEHDNIITVIIHSPTEYIKEKDKEYHLGGSIESMKGFPHLRKAHCMFGWDWGPRLPDMGIWKDVSLLGFSSRITDIKIHQDHFMPDGRPVSETDGFRCNMDDTKFNTINADAKAGPVGHENNCLNRKISIHAQAARDGKIKVCLTVNVKQSGHAPLKITLTTPASCTGEGSDILSITNASDENSAADTLKQPDKHQPAVYELENGKPFTIPDPRLWWPNGLGEQPLYTLTVELYDSYGASSYVPGRTDDTSDISKTDGTGQYSYDSVYTSPEIITKKTGLRTLTIRRTPDRWGETFAAEINGQTFFAMGADYIPEDNILSRLSEERTGKLLRICRDSHFNAIRVWGGGIYPMDYFYDLCDELGLVVWQDMMFACANYRLTDEFEKNITEEIRENVRRLRHHPSLGLWCGNNEMEDFELKREYDGDEITVRDYLIQNEHIIPQILKEEDPDTFYWPSSPSSGGGLKYPQDPDRGDVHYWEVWHGGVPFTEYRKYHFRYLSEFGFQSFPDYETIKDFTAPGDRNIFSRIMEMHQRNSGANGKILQYLSETYLYPGSFELLIYASELLQADAIRYGVEHFRRYRNDDRCMGAIYWQLNDIWPVASWSSVDYFFRWKALQYAAVRFFDPVMISCEEVNEITTRGSVVAEPSENVSTMRLSVTNETWDPVSGTAYWELRDPESNIIKSGSDHITVEPFSSLWLETHDFSDTDFLSNHVSYSFVPDSGSKVSVGTVLFTAPKHYKFADPSLTLKVYPDGKHVEVFSGAFAKSVEVYDKDTYVRFDDNFFDMEKGSRTLTVIEGKISDPADLKVRSVYDIR
ncbi:MAG: glycoside hydrolase family 2 protein [Lachnospiraceae bacterium]|jgi:beta-mannosidase|nr:glycoside hydrolase family 2 protein [Lachnospiraceae bacterium]MEE3461470.1 glycoside hydrolase family 2 protein [Lachnospiraceae bacterium]